MAPTLRLVAVILICGLLTMGAVVFYQSSHSEILISDHMSEFIQAVNHKKIKDRNKLIIFDLEDTVFMADQILGTPTWFYNMINLAQKKGLSRKDAYLLIEHMDKIIQNQTSVSAVEKHTLWAIKSWQKSGLTVIGLTSRPQSMIDVTLKQLKQIGLSFDSHNLLCFEENWHHESAFKNGILFVSYQNTKHEVVDKFLSLRRKCGLKVKLIAHADDQQRYINEVAVLAKKHHIDFIAIIYSGALANRRFDLAQAIHQLKIMENSLKKTIVPKLYKDLILN